MAQMYRGRGGGIACVTRRCMEMHKCGCNAVAVNLLGLGLWAS